MEDIQFLDGMRTVQPIERLKTIARAVGEAVGHVSMLPSQTDPAVAHREPRAE